MSTPFNSHDSGPVGGLFGSQIEQRVGHRDMEHDDELGQGRRLSEGRDSRSSSFETKQLGLSPPKSSASSSRPNKSWLKMTWSPWRRKSTGGSHPFRSQHSIGHVQHNDSWWHPRRYSRLALGSTAGTLENSVRSIIRYLRIRVSAMIAAMIRGKRRRSWFLGLILVSLLLTAFSGGYLQSQLQHQSVDPSTPLTGNNGAHYDIPLGTSTGSRLNRHRGKKYRPPEGETGRDQMPPGKDKVGPGEPDRATNGKGNVGFNGDNDVPQGWRICNLEEVAHGQWIFSEEQAKVTPWTLEDLSWTGYGHNGCRSSIWNERYLLTPSKNGNSTTLNSPLLQMDREYAKHLKRYSWQVNLGQAGQKLDHDHGQGVQDQQGCWQPEMDVVDFVEVLKRAPLVMIGDKFLEQEYLTMECMIMGMQDQLLLDYKSEKKGAVTDEEAMKSLDYRIESEMPPIVELKVAPGFGSGIPPVGTHGSTISRGPSNVYRKAKPGEMRLVDRVSNLTLMTFIRSDVLWDPGMLAPLVTKHGLTSVMELSELDASGLHPDCKLVGTVLLCEPARIEAVGASRGAVSTHWWQRFLGGRETPLEPTKDRGVHDGDDDDERDMSFGSDLRRDMINLEWVQSLDDIIRTAQRESVDEMIGRKPVVMISNGHFWEFDQDTVRERRDSKKASKVEEDMMRGLDKRRKLLRQRYTMMLTNVLEYVKGMYPDVPVVVQTSVRRSRCGTGDKDKEMKQEAALLNALTKVRDANEMKQGDGWKCD